MDNACASVQDSLPFKDGKEPSILDERKNTEVYKNSVEEYRDVMEVKRRFPFVFEQLIFSIHMNIFKGETSQFLLQH